MRIQLNGLSPSHKSAPKADYAIGLPWSGYSHRYHVLFEMHDRSLWERRGHEYLDYLRGCDAPIYMQRVEPDIPMSREFPLERAIALGGDYFNSSIAYMLAWCAMEGADVDIYGVDNHSDEEWWFERPCNEYWIGVLKGMGRDVWIHPESSVTKFMPDIKFGDEVIHYVRRYGYVA